MAYKTITFEGAEITDADASDGVVVVGGLTFTVTAPGAWTLNFVGNRLNFSEDPAYAGSQFKIEITDVDGGQFKYADYVIGYTANPAVVNGWTPGLNINGMTMGDTDFSGNYQHPDHSKFAWRYSSGGMGGEVTTSKITIFDEPAIGDTQNPHSTLWLDNIVVDTDLVPPNVTPTFVGATTSISASQDTTALDVSALLHVSDTDLGQTLFWTQASAPAHGTLSFSGAAAASGGTDIGSGGTITYRPNAGFAGVDTFTVQVSDGTATTTRTITVNVLDTTAPTTTVSNAVFSADTGLSATDFVTRVAAQTISGTLSANLAADETVQVSLNNGNTWTTAITSVGSNAWSLAGVMLSGSNTLLVKVTDTAGNDSAVYAQAYVLDTTAPLVAITSDRTALKAGETATITFSFSEDPGATFTWDGSAGDVVVSGGTLSALTGSGITRTAVFTPSAGLNSGTAGITVAAGSYIDAAGNNGGAGVLPSLTFDMQAPSAPSMPDLAAGSDSGVSDSDNLTYLNTLVLTGTAETGATITLYDSDGVTVIGTGMTNGSVWSITTSPLVAGTHIITARATDTAGNTSSASAGLSVIVDTVSTVVVPNPIGGVDITIMDPSQLTAALGTSGVDHVFYSGSGTVILPDTIENITLSGNADVQGNGLGNLMRRGSGENVLDGRGGDDTLYGDEGDDQVEGGTGNDVVSGGAGQDRVSGGSGSDNVQGGAGNDRVYGDAGRDTVSGGSGNDFVEGGSGNDRLSGAAGQDRLYGGEGRDLLAGGSGHTAWWLGP
jgi:Ca2+-binding RTX toxin-like protein